jgi:1,4-alpha-glucan branching enzyme
MFRKKTKVSKKAKKTQFSLSAPQAEKVFIAGDFNQWNLGFTSSESKRKRDLENFAELESSVGKA